MYKKEFRKIKKSLHVGQWKEIFAREQTATHKPASAQPLIVTTMTHMHKIAGRGEARRPPKTNVDTETAFRHDYCKTRAHIQKVNISEVRGQFIRSNSEVRVDAGAKFGHTGCWSIATCSHAGTSEVDFEVDRTPPAACPPGDLLTTMVKETVIWYEKQFRKMNKSRISH